ncbi:MAG: hypothetical protein IK080_11340 [Clostridia bacterium]|nr:hypothetical protein [Clostridia bacterium]
MTNQEQYKRTFDTVASSRMQKLEASDIMERRKKNFSFKGAAVALAAVLILISLFGAAYASDLGGIQSKVQVWYRGELTDVTLEITPEGSYTMEFTDENGNPVKQEGGGVAIGPFGKERPLTQDEILEHLNEPEVVYEDDGTVWVYYGAQKTEITDQFDEDGVCHVKLVGEGKPIYMTITYMEGYTTSGRKFPKPVK